VVGNLKGVDDGLKNWKKKEDEEEEQRENAHKGEREERSCMVVLQNCPGFKVEMSKLPIGLILCQKICSNYHFFRFMA